ncbi:hypothetical protein JYK14_15400 [Siccirubricoccus sp. KC 17139]|uniref:Uncharacterized protein n=1 Tax=Siccirubricoccus soli TaxID=2899147 RepID=A0ABT1D6J1_9PROT|nr:hypothetical protein [Siccirubricoccus soli]MCO6417536.1 hypothetical protein [Siccirubricoccus soli]MCP2683671.1 hypothetical protein [Siccirubricoccus soli]
MTNKHPQGPANRGGAIDDGDTPRPPDDLKRNPGIGSSKGGDRKELLAGDATEEGDVMNDTTRQGGVNPGQRGRTNK